MSLHEIATSMPAVWLAIGGFGAGLVFGASAFLSNFCVMGAIADIHGFGDWRRMRAYLLALAVAIAGLHGLAAAGVVEPARSMYLASQLDWLGAIIGGLAMGYGMVLAGGCPSRNLVRAGAGDLRSGLTLLVMAVVAGMTLGGVIGPLRDGMSRATAIDAGAMGLEGQWLAVGLARLLPLEPGTAQLASAGGVALALLVFCLASRRFLASPGLILGGLGVGLAVVGGWAVSGLAFDEMATQPTTVGSLTFVRPAFDTLDWLQRFTAQMLPGFGVSSVLGALAGAHLAARATGRVRLGTFADLADTRRHLAGAALMGFGGVTALGCTIGQGVTGLSTLALGSMLATGAIMAGGVLALHGLERSLERAL